ncbi:MAG: ATP-dependent DNA helicase Rep [Halobacteriovoraceae bacterium]|nr:ATP-dependent DNA helicase Rep [Halobacteriovoraceae bacterium]|tara:strand:- start:57115 stop:59151 length:2037 start_codon:yes stop_codon:yes gene_type:complete
MISLSGLNPEQRSAAEAIEGPVLILAGAGSGKTRTITYRIAHMVSNLAIPGKNILGVSFTNKAAKEMRERVIALLGKTKSRGITLTTFHSLGVKILKKEIDKLGYHLNFSIYDTSDQLGIIREALKVYQTDKKFDHKRILSKIGSMKNRGISSEDFLSSPYFDEEEPYDLATEYAYRYYQDKLKFFNAIDFDDILFLVVELFDKYPEVAEKYSEKFQYIMIDEYQDTNGLQLKLIMGLVSKHDNLCVVGDDDQSIYAFRGADITNILEFERQFPNAKVIKLEQNYRSTSPILSLANHIIKENKQRRAKTLWSTKESNLKPILWAMGDTDHEAQVVVDEIAKFQAKGGHLGDIAILYRSNTQAQPIEDELRIAQVPYTVLGGQKFYEKKEIKDLIAYFSVMVNPYDQMALRRILNVPHRGIGNATLDKFLLYSEQNNVSLFEAMQAHPDLAGPRAGNIQDFVKLIHTYQEKFKQNSLAESCSVFVEDIKFLQYIDKQYDNAKQADRRKNDIMMFLESAERFQKFQSDQATLKNFVEKLLLQDNQDRQEDEEDEDIRKNEVTMMTLHSSKGLEFDIVYLIGMEEEILPHKKTITDGEDISEERRLAYVGVTRAREKLFMTFCKERKIYGRKVTRYPSRFLYEMDPLYVNQDRTTFGHLTEEEKEEHIKSTFASLSSLLDD